MVGKTNNITVRVSRDTTESGYTLSVADTTIASAYISETDDETVVITGKKVGSTTLTATSIADPSASATIDLDVVSVTNPTIKVSADKTSVTQKQTINLSAAVSDYNGDVTYSWKSLYAKGSFSGDKTSNSVTYTGNTIGSDTIQVSFNIGTESYTDTIMVVVLADHTGWTSLSTADDVKNNLLTAGTINGKYYLTSDIDLSGYEITYTGSIFAGTIDGQGYSISNFSVDGNPADNYSNGGFFSSIAKEGRLYNLGFDDVVIGQKGSGWGTSVICCACEGNLENISVSVTHTFDNSSLIDANEWFPFNSAFVGIYKEATTYRNIVVNVNTDPEAGYKTIFADVAYPAGGAQGLSAQTSQTFSVQGFYTNSTIYAGSVWEWGGPVEDDSGYSVGISWNNSVASSYGQLDPQVWNLTDGAKPSLKALA